MWASALRAGRSFAQALDTLVEEAGEPAHSEFRRAQQPGAAGRADRAGAGRHEQAAASESFELVVLTTDVQRRIGGNVAVIFDQVADTVRKRQQFSARVRALMAMGVMSAQRAAGHAVRARGDPDRDQPRLHVAAVRRPEPGTC